MKKYILIQMLVMALFAVSINNAKADNLTLSYKTISKNKISTSQPLESFSNYYYDKNGNLAIYDDNKVRFTIYSCDEVEGITNFKIFSRVFGAELKYELTSYGHKIYVDGKITEEVTYLIGDKSMDSLSYTYDQTGNLIEINKWGTDYYSRKTIWMSKTSYSDFQYPNCPKLTEIWRLKYNTSWKYVASKVINTYNAQAEKVKVEEKNRNNSDTTIFDNIKHTDYYYNSNGLLDSCCSFSYSGQDIRPNDKFEYFYNNGILEKEKRYLTQMIWPGGGGGPLKNNPKIDVPYVQILAPESEKTYYNSSNYSADNVVLNFNAEFIGNATVKLNWETPVNSSGLTGYRIIFQNKENIDVPANTNEYNLTDVKIGSYFTAMQALYGEIGSNITDPVFVQVADANCAAPTGLKLNSEVVYDESTLSSIINISWLTPQTDYQVLNYIVYVNGDAITSSLKDTNYIYKVLKSGDYKFEIQAVYSQGTSPKSEPLRVDVIHKYKITLTQNNSKAGIISGEGIYDDKSEVTIKATANEGFSFTEWQRQVTATYFEFVSSEAEYKFTLTKGETFIAVFDAIKYEITAIAHENGKISPSGIAKVAHGKNLTYTITPDQDYVVKKLLVDNKEIKDATHLTSYTFENVKETHSIEVSFQDDDGIDENLDNVALVYGYGKSIIVKTTDNVTRQIEVSDISGKVIKSISSNVSNEIIEIENPGVYIVRIFDNNKVINTKKIIIK